MLGTAAGIRTIDPQLLLAARSMGATLPQLITRVILPASIPAVLAGLRMGGALVIVGVVVSEMLISTAGIGYMISFYPPCSTARMSSLRSCFYRSDPDV